jgi:hypothetical protein
VRVPLWLFYRSAEISDFLCRWWTYQRELDRQDDPILRLQAVVVDAARGTFCLQRHRDMNQRTG